MGVAGLCVKFSAAIVALVAIAIGALLSGEHTGLFNLIDKHQSARGMLPVLHDGPWGFVLEDMPDLTGETFLVTGANVGLGYWTAVHLAAANGHVILGCRTTSKCEDAVKKLRSETGKGQVETLSLDLSSFKSIRAAAKEVAAKHPKLNSLILNAGVMMCPFALTEDGIESQIGTNHFGHQLLTQLLLPQVEAAAAASGVATVVSVSSAAHYNSYPEGILPTLQHLNDESTYNHDAAYGQSKLANVLFAQELAERVQSKNVLVNSVHPGLVDTDLFRHIEARVRAFSDTVADKVQSFTPKLMWHPREAALTQLYCAVGPKLRQSKITGKYFHPIARENEPSTHSFNKTLQQNLWKMTEDFIASH